MSQLTERQVELLRALQFHGGTLVVRVLAVKEAYEHLVDKGYVVSTHLADGDLHCALTHNGRAVLNSFND